VQYKDENDLLLLKSMIDKELVEPYSIFTFRMFVHPWPQLCHFCYVDGAPVGVVVCKIDDHKSGRRRGYLGMIVVEKEYRKLGIGVTCILSRCACTAMGIAHVLNLQQLTLQSNNAHSKPLGMRASTSDLVPRAAATRHGSTKQQHKQSACSRRAAARAHRARGDGG
jgi:GNAT superfamily N-acetyltransferase